MPNSESTNPWIVGQGNVVYKPYNKNEQLKAPELDQWAAGMTFGFMQGIMKPPQEGGVFEGFKNFLKHKTTDKSTVAHGYDRFKNGVLYDIVLGNLDLPSMQGVNITPPAPEKKSEKSKDTQDHKIKPKLLVHTAKLYIFLHYFKNSEITFFEKFFGALAFTLPRFGGRGYVEKNLIHQVNWLIAWITSLCEFAIKALATLFTFSMRKVTTSIRKDENVGISLLKLIFFGIPAIIPWAIGQFIFISGDIFRYSRHAIDATSVLLTSIISPLYLLGAGARALYLYWTQSKEPKWLGLPTYLNPLFAFGQLLKNVLLLIPALAVLVIATIPGGQLAIPGVAWAQSTLAPLVGWAQTLVAPFATWLQCVILGLSFASIEPLIAALFRITIHETAGNFDQFLKEGVETSSQAQANPSTTISPSEEHSDKISEVSLPSQENEGAEDSANAVSGISTNATLPIEQQKHVHWEKLDVDEKTIRISPAIEAKQKLFSSNASIISSAYSSSSSALFADVAALTKRYEQLASKNKVAKNADGPLSSTTVKTHPHYGM